MSTEPVFSGDLLERRLHGLSHQSWLDDTRNSEVCPEKIVFEALGEMLLPLMLFLANGMHKGSFGERAWVILYCVRPDLLDGRTHAFAQNRYGYNQSTLSLLVAEFEEQFPHFKVTGNREAWTKDHKSRWSESRSRRRAARRAVHELGLGLTTTTNGPDAR